VHKTIANDQSKTDRIVQSKFSTENPPENPILISKDAISLRPKQALDGRPHCGETVRGSFELSSIAASRRRRHPRIISNQFESPRTPDGPNAVSVETAAKLEFIRECRAQEISNVTNSLLVQSVAFAAASVTRLSTAKTYDKLNRLGAIVNTYTAPFS
jgi:hypothetical protein